MTLQLNNATNNVRIDLAPLANADQIVQFPNASGTAVLTEGVNTNDVTIDGDIQAGGDPLAGNEVGVLIEGDTGEITCRTQNNGDLVFSALSVGNNDAGIQMFANGRAQFDGDATAGTDAGVIIQGPDGRLDITTGVSGSAILQGFAQGTADPAITMFADGNVRINGGTGEGSGIDLNGAGILQASRANPGNRVFEGFNDGVTSSEIFANGNMTIDGTLTENGSDIKFKKELRSIPTSQLEDIKNLQFKEWTWTEDAPGTQERNERRNRGLIAQEAELVDPKLVYEIFRGDEDDEDRFSYKAIDHQVLIMKLLGAVQELSAEVEALKGGGS